MSRLTKLIIRLLLKLLYRVEVKGLDNYYKAGKRVLIVANHTSLLDGPLLYAWLPETPTFAVNTDIARQKRFSFFMQFVDLFLMDSNSALSIKSMINFIRKDKKAVIFPEGRISTTGTLMKIYEGPAFIASKSGAMILPIAIDGGQISPFSYQTNRGHIRWFPKITITILPPEKIEISASLSGNDRRKVAIRKMQKLMFNLQYKTFDHNKTLLEATYEASKKFGPNLVVLEDTKNQKVTYKQLFIRMVILSRAMEKTTSLGETVGLMLPNVNALAISFFALQYLDRVPAILNFASGSQNIIRACETAKIKTIFTSDQFISKAGLEMLVEDISHHVNIIFLEDLRKKITNIDKLCGLWLGRNPIHRQQRKVASNHRSPAVILFTSGSEGTPKGVVLSHQNILSNFAQVRIHIDFRASDTVFTCLPLFHSFALNAGFISPLLGGSKVYLYPTPLHYRLIPQIIYDKNATIFFSTNTFLKGYAKYAHPYDFHNLRFVGAGAEKLRNDTGQLYMEKYGIRIYQGYGLTETSPVIAANSPLASKIGTVGTIIPDIDFYLKPVEGINKGGQLVVRGPNIMMGYLIHGSNGKITPPSTERGDGWHDTGDIVDIDTDGYVTILGRSKRFAKLGGEMVSLTVVEELAIYTWPGTNHAALAIPDDIKGEKIILVTDNPKAERNELLETIDQLKYSKIYFPSLIISVKELPVLNTGKTDYINLTKMIHN